MKPIHRTLIINFQLVLFISIINFSFGWDKKSLIKKNYYINKSLRFLQNPSDSTTDNYTNIPTNNSTSTPTEGPTDNSTNIPTNKSTDTVKEETITPAGNATIHDDDTDVPSYHDKKSSSGLSTGAICAIAIPTIAALLGVAAAAALCKGGSVATPAFTPPTLPPPNYIDTSLDKFNVVHELPPQQPLPQPQVQPVHIEPQPIPRPIRPNYPINKVEPPLVNRAFQPMYNIQQPMQMVPVQQVQMVPVQQVEMVPVEEVVPVQQVVPVQEVVPVQQAVNVQEVVPVQQVQQVQQITQIPIPQVTETLPNISPVDDSPGVGQVINSGQVIQQGQALPDSSLGFSVQNLI
jgi:hypothetical protein